MLLNQEKKKNCESWKICSFNLPGVLLLREGNEFIRTGFALPRGMLAIFPGGLTSFESLSATRDSICSSPLSQSRGLLGISQQTSVISSLHKSKSRCLERAHCELWHGRKMDAFQNRRSPQRTKILAQFLKGLTTRLPSLEDLEMLLIISKLLQDPFGTPKQQLD